METRVLKQSEPGCVEAAAAILRGGGLVALPTETVYGLAASAQRPEAVARIFTAKGRPNDNPLILHVASPDGLEACCLGITAEAYLLAERFWPGPLTIILPRQPWVPDEVTAGLDTVAVRCPDCDITREIIRAAGAPLAAPSANISGKPSPTRAGHVLDDLGGRIDAVVDGGECRVGLESTIVDLSVSPPRLLRPGGVTLSQLESVLGGVAADPALAAEADGEAPPRAPGMKYSHYAPKAPLYILKGPAENAALFVNGRQGEKPAVLCFDEESGFFEGVLCRAYGSRERPEELAHNLFAALRDFDREDIDVIYARCPEGEGVEMAVTNRLVKAAAHDIIEV